MKLVSLAALLALSLPALAHADGKSDAEAIANEAQSAYDGKQYKKAADGFMFAFTKDENPIYLFNAAQAYRLDGHSCAASLDAYKRFMDAVKGQDIPNIDRVQAYMKEMETCARNGGSNVTEPPNNPPPNPPVGPKDKPAQPKPVETAHASHVPSYALVGGGVLLVGVGFYFNKLMNDEKTNATTALGMIDCSTVHSDADCRKLSGNTVGYKNLDDANDAGKRDNIIEVAAWAAGGVAIGAGVYLYVKGKPAKEQAVVFTPTKDGAAVVGTWHF